MIPTVEEILDMPGMMVKILATGRLSANQRGRVLEPANTRTDPTPGERVFLHLVQFAWLQSEFVSTPLTLQISFGFAGWLLNTPLRPNIDQT